MKKIILLIIIIQTKAYSNSFSHLHHRLSIFKKLIPITTVDEFYKGVDTINDVIRNGAITRFYENLDERERRSAFLCDFFLHVCNVSPKNVIEQLKKEQQGFTQAINLLKQHFSKRIDLDLPIMRTEEDEFAQRILEKFNRTR